MVVILLSISRQTRSMMMMKDVQKRMAQKSTVASMRLSSSYEETDTGYPKSYTPDAYFVSSTSSKTAKKIKALMTRKSARQREGQVVVEGPRMVFDLYRHPRTRPLFRHILIDQNQWSTYRPVFDENIQTMKNRYNIGDDAGEQPTPTRSPLFIPTTAHVLKHCTDTVTHQGIVAICDIPQYTFPSSSSSTRLEGTKNTTTSTMLYLILDAVSDPGNLGTILRSSVATGVTGVILLADCVDPWNPKALRSSMGATFHIPILQIPSWKECQTILSSRKHHVQGRNIWAATMLEEDSNETEFKNNNPPTSIPAAAVGSRHFDVDWISEPSALIIGNEGNGLTDGVREAVQKHEIRTVHVPMEPGTMESLNAAVCASVILFEYHRQKQIRQIQKSS